jgi:hypothetical protein
LLDRSAPLSRAGPCCKTSLGVALRHAYQNVSEMCTPLETAVGARGCELAAERAADRCDDHAHILRGQPGLVPHDVTAPVVDEPLTCRHHVWRAARVVIFVVGQLAPS